MLHTHTFSWRDQALAIATANRMSGREYLEALRRGDVPPPPFVALLGFALDEIEDRRVVFSFRPQEFMLNGLGVLHGGVAAAVFDTAVGCACLTVVPRERAAITMDLHVRYFKPLTMKSGTARCEGEVINNGRSTLTAQGRLFDAAGRLCGLATSTLALIDPSITR